VIATKNRVPPPTNLRDDLASGDMSKWTFLETLPSPADMNFMRQMFVVLVGRILVKRMKWMGEYKLEESVVKEVEHAYSEEMRQKSEEVRAIRDFSGHA
jgi:site-specific recombinase XerC